MEGALLVPCLSQSSHRMPGKVTSGDRAGDGAILARGSDWAVWGCPHRGSQPHKASLSPETFPVLHVTPAPGGGPWEPFDVPEPFPFPVPTPRLRARGIKNPLSAQLRPHPHGDLLSLTGPTGRWQGARVAQSSHAAHVGSSHQHPPSAGLCLPGVQLFLPDTGGSFPLSWGGQRWKFLEGCCG